MGEKGVRLGDRGVRSRNLQLFAYILSSVDFLRSAPHEIVAICLFAILWRTMKGATKAATPTAS